MATGSSVPDRSGVTRWREARAARPRRRRSRLGVVTVSLMLLALGTLAVIDQGTRRDPSTAQYLALALGVVGGGLLVGTVLGRSRGLILLGLPILLVLVPVWVFDLELRGGVDRQSWSPGRAADIQPRYERGLGGLRLDLTGVDFTGQDVATSLAVTGGYLQVLVPPEVDVVVRVEMQQGQTQVFGETTDGENRGRVVRDPGVDGSGGGVLELTLTVNLGYVEVDRVGF